MQFGGCKISSHTYLNCKLYFTVGHFADDTKVYNNTNNEILQQDLDALFVWSKLWQLCFNVDKCKTIHFGRNNQNYQYTMNFEDIDSA